MAKSGSRTVEGADVRQAYARWAPVYELIATPTVPARKIAAARVNAIGGRFLEAGVGSGSALPLYGSNVSVVGVDLSHDMLKIARARTGLDATVEGIIEMDLMSLAFPDNTFDGAVCMFTITAVPDAVRVAAELGRVVRPGGTVLVASHFKAERGIWRVSDAAMTPFAKRLGWNPSLPIDALLSVPGLDLEHRQELPPASLITLLTYRVPS